jgi:hypothetical protein
MHKTLSNTYKSVDLTVIITLKSSTSLSDFILQRRFSKLSFSYVVIHCSYTVRSNKNGAVSKVNNKCISHLIRAQRTPSAAATVQVSHALPVVSFSCLLRGWGASFQDVITVLTLHCNHRSGHLKMEHTESLFLLRRHFRNWPHDPAVSMRSELRVAHENLGQLSLLAVYVVPV